MKDGKDFNKFLQEVINFVFIRIRDNKSLDMFDITLLVPILIIFRDILDKFDTEDLKSMISGSLDQNVDVMLKKIGGDKKSFESMFKNFDISNMVDKE